MVVTTTQQPTASVAVEVLRSWLDSLQLAQAAEIQVLKRAKNKTP
jgi:hypothetical protein